MQNKKQVQQKTATTCRFKLCSEEHRNELAHMLEFCTFQSDQIQNEVVVNNTKVLIKQFIENYCAVITKNG